MIHTLEKQLNRVAIQRGILIFSLLFTILISLFTQIKLRDYAFDDAYIHFRIVNNLIVHGEPYFNNGEHVKTSTSTGWIILLFIIIKIISVFSHNIQIPLVVATLNSFLLIFNSLIYTILTKKITNHRISTSISAILFLVFLSISFYTSIGLMETIAALLIVGVAFLLYLNQNRYSLLLFSMSIFFRPELIVAFILIILHALYTKRFSLLNILILVCIGLIPFLIFDIYFYGTIISNSIRAKSIIYSLTIGKVLGIIISRIYNFYALLPFFDRFPLFYLSYPLFIFIFFNFLYILRLRKSLKGLIKHIVDSTHKCNFDG